MSETVKRLKALSNEHRLAIFEYLRRQEISCGSSGEACCVGNIAQQFDLALSTVSQHLRELKEAGLIECRHRGQYTYCTINEEAVKELQRFFSPKG